MLVLSRKQDEQIVIDEQIRLTVIGIGGGRCRIGIDAPQSVSIRRGELVRDSEVLLFRTAASLQLENAS